MNMFKMLKKGQSSWLSWILLVALTIIIITFMYRWMTDYAQQASDDLIQTFENTEECDNVAIQISACQASSQNVLYANVTNRGFLKVDRVMFQLFDAHGNAVNRAVNKTIRPNHVKTLTVIRQDIVDSFDAIPVLKSEKAEVICSDRTVTVSSVSTC